MNKLFSKIFVFLVLLMPVLVKAQPATSRPIINYKFAFAYGWGGITIPGIDRTYGGPANLYHPLDIGKFDSEDGGAMAAVDKLIIKPLKPASIGGGELEIYGNANTAYPSTLEIMNPFTKVRFLSTQIAIDKDGVLLLGGFARIYDEKVWKTNSIKQVSTKQRRVPLTNEITETDVLGDTKIIKISTEALSIDRSIPKSMIQKQATDKIPAINEVKGIAYDPRRNHQDHFFYSTSKAGDNQVCAYFFDSKQIIVLNAGAVQGMERNVSGRMVVDNNGNIYIADAEQHIIVKFEMSDDGKKSTGFKLIAGSIGHEGYKDDSNLLDARFNTPSGIAIDENDNLYISDTGNNCIRKIDLGLFDDVSTYAGSKTGESGSWSRLTKVGTEARFNNPMGIAYDYKNKLLYVADNGNNIVRALYMDKTVESMTGNPEKLVGTSFQSPTDIAVEPGGLGFYVAAGRIVQYVNTFDGGCRIEAQYREIPDPLFTASAVAGVAILPPGLFMKANGAITGVPLLVWEPSAYIVYGSNNVGKSVLPAVVVLEVIECPEKPDTVIANQSIAFSQLPYTWNKLVFTEAGTKTVTIKSRAGCDSTVIMNLSVPPKILYSGPNSYSLGVPIVPLLPVNTGTTPDNYTISPPLPAGLMLDPVNGKISGTPSAVSYQPSVVLYGPQTAPVTKAPWDLGTLGGDISSVKITDQRGTVLLNNKTQIRSLGGTIGTATGTAGAYSDFSTNAITNLYQGETYTINVSNLLKGPTPVNNGIGYGYEYGYDIDGTSLNRANWRNSFAIFIDYNRNGDFSDPGERVYRTSDATNTSHTESTSIVIPAGFLPGVTKMRIHWMEADVLRRNNNGIYYIDTDSYLTPYPYGLDPNPGIEELRQKLFMNNGEFEDYGVNLIGNNGLLYTVKASNSTGSDSTQVNIAIAKPTLSSNNQTICESELPFVWNGLEFKNSASKAVRLKNRHGADSTATMNLTVIEHTSSTTDISFCGTYTWNGQIIVNSGIYKANFRSAVGCDSIAILNFRQKATRSVENKTLRPADLPSVWNGQSYNRTVTASKTLKNAEGCDSIATLNLLVNYDIRYPARTILPLNIPIRPIAPAFEGNFQIDVPGANGHNGFWLSPYTSLPPGLSLDPVTGIISGTPTQLIPWSTYTIRLIQTGAIAATFQLSVGVPTTSTLNYSSCDSYFWNNKTYNSSGTYSEHFINQYGMDSTAILNLTVRKPSSSVTNLYSRPDQLPITWHGQSLTAEGVYTRTITNAAGCDSAMTLHFYIAPKISYTTPNLFGLGVAITPLLPANTGGIVPSDIGIVKTNTTKVQPTAITIDKEKNIYFITLDGSLIKQSPDGIRSVLINYLGNASALTTDDSGNIYAALTSRNSIVKVSPEGNSTVIASARLPIGIAIDASGNVYFSEFSNHRIRKLSPNGVVSTLAGSGVAGYANGTGTSAKFNVPAGLAINATGDIFVADLENNRIRKISPSGVVSTYAGNGANGLVNGPAGSASFSSPSAIVSDPYGNLYIVDQSYAPKAKYAAKIRKISGDGLVSTLAGSTAGYADGTGNQAQFYDVQGLTIDATGHLYVSDLGNGAIRTINTQTYQIKPSLPEGLNFDLASGRISGTPAAMLPKPMTYTVSAFNRAGADSAKVLIAICSPTPTSFAIDACDHYNWDGTDYATDGTYTRLYTNMGGCDSLVTLNLKIRKSTVGPIVSVSTCGYYDWQGTRYTQTGLYTAHLLNKAGCDSLARLDLALAKCDNTFISGGEAPNISYPVKGDTTFYYTGPPVILNPTNSGGAVPVRNLNQSTLVLDLNANSGMFKTNYVDIDGVSTVVPTNIPQHMVKDAAGNYYFTHSNQIFKIVTDGSITVFAGTGNDSYADGQAEQASFSGPAGLAFDNTGNLYVADRGNNVIRKITPEGLVTTIGKYIGTGITGDLSVDGNFANAVMNAPYGLVFDKNGDLLVSENLSLVDAVYGAIRRISFSTNIVSTVAVGLNYPQALAMDVFGNIIVIEGGFDTPQLKKITPGGQISIIAGNGTNSGTDGQLDGVGSASSLPYLSQGALYINPTNNIIYFSNNVGQLSRIESNGFVRKLFWLNAGGGMNDARCILEVDDAGRITYVNGKALILQSNTVGYGGSFLNRDFPLTINANGVISGGVIVFRNSEFITFANVSRNDVAYASNQYGFSSYPMAIRNKYITNYVDRIVVSGFPYVWHGQTFNGPTNTATDFSATKTLINDTLYHLDLIYDIPLPAISTTAVCATNSVTLNAGGSAGNAIHFNGSSHATFPVAKEGKYLVYSNSNIFTLPVPIPGRASIGHNPSTAFEAWIKPESVSGVQYIVAKDSVESNQGHMAVLINNGKLEYRFNNGTLLLTARSSTNLQPGVWAHIAATFCDSTMNVYINGALSGTVSLSSVVFPSSYYNSVEKKYYSPDFTLGALSKTQSGFKGSMDEVRWWSSPRKQADIVANMNKQVLPSSPGLALYYKFDEAAGDTLIDSSISNRSADLFKTPVREILSSAPIHYNSYLWSPGNATTRSITVNPVGTSPYTLTVTDFKGAAGSVTRNISPAATTSVDVIKASGDSYLWHGTTYRSSNNSATWKSVNAAGCDSTVTLNLTLTLAPVPVITANGPVNLREGGSVTLSTGNFASYVWSPTGATTSSITVNPENTATYTVTVTDSYGFSAATNITVTVCHTTYSTEKLVGCGSFAWHGTTYTASNNTATWTGTNQAGCDSIVTLNLTINPLPEPVISPVNGGLLCSSGTAELAARASGNAISFNGTSRVIEDSMGVDPAGGFTIEGWLNLSKPGTVGSFISQVNTGRSLPFDAFINADGTVAFEVGNSAALSSVTTGVKLTAGQWFHLAFVYNANVIKIYVNGNQAASGSSVTPAAGMMNNFMIGNRSDLSRPLFGTVDEIRVWNTARSQSAIAASMNKQVATNSASLVGYYKFDDLNADYPANSVTGISTATLIGSPEVKPSAAPVNYESYLWSAGGATTSVLTANVDGVSSFTVTVTDVNGCRNTVSKVVPISQPSSSTQTASACESYTWHGVTYTSSTNTAQWITPNAAGCDSVVTLHLTITQPQTTTETVTACNYYVWHGQTYDASTNSATWKGVNAAGCDSVVTLHLTILESSYNIETIVACGASYTWHGTTYTSDNDNGVWAGVNAAGCDSIVTLNLQFSKPPELKIISSGILDLCAGDTITLGDMNANFIQYASKITAFSSQYFSGRYSANQILGAPDTYPEYGDLPTAWSSSTEKSNREFIELEFVESKRINLIDIYETYNPGSIDTVYVKNQLTDRYEVVYTATPDSTIYGSRILSIRFPLTNFPVSEVKITMNSPAVPGFKGIDAVAVGMERDISYSWSNGSQERTIKVTAPGKYFVTATNAVGCMSIDSVEVKAIPTPVITAITNTQSICSGSEIIPITAAVSSAGAFYYWSRDNDAGVSGMKIFGDGEISGTLVNQTNTPQVVTYRITPVFSGCTGEPVTTTVLVNPIPPPPTISVTGSATICKGDSTILTSSHATGNQWFLNDVVIIGATASGYSAKVSGNYTVRYNDQNMCISSSSSITTVTVNPLPVVAAITGSPEVCLGSVTTLSNTTSSGIWSSTTSPVATVDANGAVTGILAGGSVIHYTVTALGCATTVSKPINVKALPAAMAGANRTICQNESTSLGELHSSGSNYSWTSVPAGFIAAGANPTVSPMVNTTYILTETSTLTGCSNTHSVVVTVNPIPAAVAGADRIICLNGGTSLGAAAISGNTYSWSSVPAGFTSAEANPAVSPKVTTTYTVVETVTATGCTNSHSVVVTIKSLYIPQVTGAQVVCAGTTGVPYSTAAVMTGYKWTLPRGAKIVSGDGTNAITVDFSPTASLGNVVVNGISDCGFFTTSNNYAVLVNPIPSTPRIIVQGHTLISSTEAGNQWYLDGAPISRNGTSKQYTALISGNYTVISTQNKCASLSSAAVAVGSMEATAIELSVYPNPNHGQFNFRIETGEPADLIIDISNNNGEILWRKNKFSVEKSYMLPVDISNVPPGIYTIRVHNNKINQSSKLIITK
jgi:sugar lactone lactonase YvrE